MREEGAAEQEQPRGRFEPVHVRQVIEQPPVEFLVEGFLPRNGPSVIAGFSGGGKSLLAKDVSLSVAAAHPFCGDRAVKQGLVVYVAAEGYRGFGQRVGAWLDYHAIAGTEVNALPVYFVPDAPQFMDTVQVAAFLKGLERLPEAPTLIVVDTLARTFVGGDENSGKDLSAYLAGIDTVQRETGALVCIIHHSGWNTERERGWSGLRGSVETMALVTKEDNRVTLSCLKQKDADEFPALHFELRPHTDSVVLVPVSEEDRRQRPAVLPRTRQQALDALTRCSEAGGLAFTKWCDSSGLARATFTRCVADLDSWGLIEKQGGKWVAL
jgi:hypothetical protein